jgi:hypothetical protein
MVPLTTLEDLQLSLVRNNNNRIEQEKGNQKIGKLWNLQNSSEAELKDSVIM